VWEFSVQMSKVKVTTAARQNFQQIAARLAYMFTLQVMNGGLRQEAEPSNC